jgi:hypothetical protein
MIMHTRTPRQSPKNLLTQTNEQVCKIQVNTKTNFFYILLIKSKNGIRKTVSFQ